MDTNALFRTAEGTLLVSKSLCRSKWAAALCWIVIKTYRPWKPLFTLCHHHTRFFVRAKKQCKYSCRLGRVDF